MTKEEAYSFLDLPHSATKASLLARYKEKYTFFMMLYTNAPNEIIRTLQNKNLKALEDLKKVLEIEVNTVSNEEHAPIKSSPNKDISPKKIEADTDAVLAWLIVHTEEKSTQSFPLLEGVNTIGRQEVSGYNSIVITNDSYLSRCHCIVIINKSNWEMSAAIIDDGRFTNNKPSLNGTYVNAKEERIKKVILNEGDTVQIGMTKLVFKWNTHDIKELESEVKNSVFMGTIVLNI